MTRKVSLSMIFAIIAVALQFFSSILMFLFFRMPPSQVVLDVFFSFFGTMIAFIVPVFVLLGRRIPRMKKAFAIISFIFLGHQIFFAVLFLVAGGPLLRIGTWNISYLINGSNLLTATASLFRIPGLRYLVYELAFIESELCFLIKNLVGAIELCREIPSGSPKSGLTEDLSAPDTELQRPEVKYCTHCGAPIALSDVFCRKCGTLLTQK